MCLIDNSVKPLTECIALQVNWHYFRVDQLCNIKVIESTKGKRHFEVLSLVPFLIILLERYAYIHTIPALFRFKSRASPLSVFIPSSLTVSALHQSSYLGGGSLVSGCLDAAALTALPDLASHLVASNGR